MLDERLRAMVDQGRAAMMEVLPPMWKELYGKLQEVGFTESQAFELVKTYILSQNPFGTRP